MSSVAVCAILTRIGYSPVMQISCRDYNRIAIQGNVLGAAALGVGNVLCLTGDGVQCGDHPEAKPVFDLNSISLLSIIRTMRDEARFMSGRKLTTPPRVFLGAAENPFAPPHDFRVIRLAKKIDGRRAVRPDAILLRPHDAEEVHGQGARHGPRQALFHPGRRRPARLRQGGPLDARQRRRRAHPRRRRSPGSRARPIRGRRASASASR